MKVKIILLTLRDLVVDLLTGGEWSRIRGMDIPHVSVIRKEAIQGIIPDFEKEVSI